MSLRDLAVYIHWPFCAHKCPYCDFNSHVREHIDETDWQQAYLRAIDHYADLIGARSITSIFFGGGTPSLMNPDIVAAIIERIQMRWRMTNDCEITLEANPTSVEINKFRAFRMAGVNRVSIGVQSLDDDVLKFLGRQHSAEEAVRAVQTAGDVFDRYSFDLMYARPEQTLEQWEDELTHALGYADKHMSLYQLTIEKGTAFYTQERRGDFIMPNSDYAADFYQLTQDIMGQAGLPAYEVSNHAASGEESAHNMAYWLYKDYVGIGPGAHGRITLPDHVKYATREHSAPEKWLKLVSDNGHGAHPFEALNAAQKFNERLMMGLRLNAGIEIEDIEDVIPGERLAALSKEGLISFEDDFIQATSEGLLKLNLILDYLMNA